jgi:hypothetical protein
MVFSYYKILSMKKSYFFTFFLMEIEKRFIEVFELLENQGVITSRKQTATELGYEKNSTFTDILKGRTKVNPYLLATFCKKYGVSIAWILYGEGEMFEIPIPTEAKPPLLIQQELSEIKQMMFALQSKIASLGV